MKTLLFSAILAALSVSTSLAQGDKGNGPDDSRSVQICIQDVNDNGQISLVQVNSPCFYLPAWMRSCLFIKTSMQMSIEDAAAACSLLST